MPQFDIDINFNVDTGQIEEAKISLNELVTSAEDVSNAADEIDSSNVDDLGSSSDSASSSADGLAESLESVSGAGLDEASGSAEDLSNSLQDAKQSSDDLSDSMGVLEGGMLMGIGQQIQGIGSSAEDMAQQMDTAAISVGQLSTNVGMAEPQMIGLINNISNATFPQNEAMAYVNALNQMGVEANKLGESATNMDRINDATGMGYSNVMNLTQGLRSVGVEADNLPSSFNAIAFAQDNVNGGAATMGQVFRRQASTINEYGLSVDQTVLIMQKLSEQGVSNTKMGTELSKVLKDNNGDIQALEQSLGMEAGTLENATSITGQYEGQLMSLANEEAEHKTITQQMGAAWEDVSLSLSGVLSPMAGVMGFVGQMGSFGMTIKGLKEVMTSIGGVTKAVNTIRNAESIWIGIKTVLTGALGLESAAEEVNAASKEANAIATETETAAQEMSLGAKISATASNWALAISESAVLLPLLLIVGAVLAVVGVLWYLYNNNETVRNSIDGLISTLWNFIGIIGTVAGQVWSYLVNLWNNLVNWFSNLQTMTPLQILQLLASVLTNLNPLTFLVSGVLGRTLQTIISQGAAWVSGAVGKAKELVSNVISNLSQLPSKITTALSGVTSNLTKPFTDAWKYIEPVYNSIKDGIDFITNNMPSFGFEGDFGYSGDVEYFGFDGSLNKSLSGNLSNNNATINNNFTINGIVEEEASQYIVDSVNSYIRKQNLIRGA